MFRGIPLSARYFSNADDSSFDTLTSSKVAAFLLYDYALSKLITFYCLRLSSKLRKILK